MYCNNCGKEIMAADKFCPYCGSVINKKITFDVNMTPESIKKRAFILLEDEDFQTAEEYFDGLLDVNPEDGEVYLGKLLAQNKFRNTEQLVDYYKNLYSSTQYSLRVAELPDGQDDSRPVPLSGPAFPHLRAVHPGTGCGNFLVHLSPDGRRHTNGGHLRLCCRESGRCHCTGYHPGHGTASAAVLKKGRGPLI